MVKWFEHSPFGAFSGGATRVYTEAHPQMGARGLGGDENSPSVTAQHERSMSLLKVVMQVDTFLAGFLLWAITGTKNTDAPDPYEQVQVVLQTVTFGVFLSAIVHTAILMMSTGWRYTLNWYDPVFPGLTSGVGLCLLLVTVADAVLIELRPAVDINDSSYWCIIGCGLCLPMVIAAFVVTLQMTVLD